MTKHTRFSSPGVTEPDGITEFFYDSNPFDAGYSQNDDGRLAATKFTIYDSPVNNWYTSYEMFSYPAAGLVTKKRFRMTWGNNADLESVYTYDNEGARTSMKYPDAYNSSMQPVTGQTFNFAFDAMKRLTTMTEQASGQAWVSGYSKAACSRECDKITEPGACASGAVVFVVK
jgi:hypothetical protein